MLPIGFSFNRFPRLVHDCRESWEEGRAQALRENTELDKTVLEKISDPLVHLVRNALDHGLESPEERLAAGKGDTARWSSMRFTRAAASSSKSRTTAPASTRIAFWRRRANADSWTPTPSCPMKIFTI